jgi:hypothetical protein
MNRRERRMTSKRLGIMDFQRKLPLKKRLELMSQNITYGKQQEKEFKDTVQKNINAQLEEKESQAIYNLAESIAKQKNIPLIDAMQIAQKEYKG